jgi:hypothetical protein
VISGWLRRLADRLTRLNRRVELRNVELRLDIESERVRQTIEEGPWLARPAVAWARQPSTRARPHQGAGSVRSGVGRAVPADPLAVACPKCLARARQPCVRLSGPYGLGQPLRRAHPDRWRAAGIPRTLERHPRRGRS